MSYRVSVVQRSCNLMPKKIFCLAHDVVLDIRNVQFRDRRGACTEAFLAREKFRQFDPELQITGTPNSRRTGFGLEVQGGEDTHHPRGWEDPETMRVLLYAGYPSCLSHYQDAPSQAADHQYQQQQSVPIQSGDHVRLDGTGDQNGVGAARGITENIEAR